MRVLTTPAEVAQARRDARADFERVLATSNVFISAEEINRWYGARFLRSGGITRLTRLDDGRVMCCICFGYFTRDQLEPVPNEPGVVTDVCKECALKEKCICLGTNAISVQCVVHGIGSA